MASGSWDRTVALWSWADGTLRPLLTLRQPGPVRWLAYPFGGRNHFRPEYLPLVYELGYDRCFSGHGGFIYPRMQGRSLNLDPVMILLSLAFWSAIWGLTGAFLSTPLTVMAMVVLAQFDGSRLVGLQQF